MRRSQSVVLALLLLGAALLFLAAGRTWGQATLQTGRTLATVRIPVTGSDLAGGLSAFALGALAAAGALLATRGRARIAVGVLVSLLGAGGIAVVVAGLAGRVATAGRLSRVLAVPHLAGRLSVPLNAWPYVAVLGALALLAAGIVTVLRAGSWGALGQRYETPAARPVRDPEVAAWDALDRGEDPTTV